MIRQNFECDIAQQLRVVSTKHDAHGAFTELRGHFERTNAGAWGSGHDAGL